MQDESSKEQEAHDKTTVRRARIVALAGAGMRHLRRVYCTLQTQVFLSSRKEAVGVQHQQEGSRKRNTR